MREEGRRTRLVLRTLLGIVLLATVANAAAAHRSATATHRATTEAALGMASQRLQDTVARGVVAVEGVRGLFAASDEVDADEFRSFVARESAAELPGVTAFGLALPVARADVAAFEAGVAASLPADLLATSPFAVRPPVTADEALVVTYAQNLDGRISPAQGFDLRSSAPRAAAADDALATREVVITAPLDLVTGVTGLLFYGAVEGPGGPTDPATGHVVMAVDATPFLAPVLADDRVTLAVVDAATGTSYLDAAPGVTPEDAAREGLASAELELAGRTVLVHATPTTPAPSLLDRGILARLVPVVAVLVLLVLVDRHRRHQLAALAAHNRAVERAQRREAAAAEQERQLAEAQRTLLGAVSHDLRTPLTAIVGFASLLRDGVPDHMVREFAGRIGANATMLQHLVQDLLAFAQLEQGELHLATAPHDLAALADEAVAGIAPALDGEPVVVDAEPAVADVDPTATRRVLTNLVENATRYGDGVVRVQVRRVGGDVVVHVDDEGEGVPAGEREAIFERFRRGARGATTRVGGTGLGLAVARGLTEGMGGTLVAADAPGGGARFTMRLPATVDREDADLVAPAPAPA